MLESEPAAPRAQFAVGVCVRGGHVRAESTCRRDTSGQQFATEPKGSRDSLFLSLFIWELCVSGVEASSDRIESFKLSVCRVRRL